MSHNGYVIIGLMHPIEPFFPIDRPQPHTGTAKKPISVIHLGNDPLDPHGDGTIRAGDPLFNLMTGGRAMIANRREDGNWEVETIPDDDEKS